MPMTMHPQAPKRKDAGLLRQAEALLAARGVPVERRGRHHLNLLSNDRPHGVSGGLCTATCVLRTVCCARASVVSY